MLTKLVSAYLRWTVFPIAIIGADCLSVTFNLNIGGYYMEEIWKDIDGYEGLYQVSNLGRVRSLDRVVVYSNGRECLHKGKIINNHDNGHGYRYITLTNGGKRKNHYVHRIVAEAFIINEDCLPEVNHIDNDRSNNDITNLEWCSKKENMNHMIKQDRQIKGSDVHCSKLNEEKVIEIRKLISQGESYGSIADKFNICKQTISNIKLHKIWKHVG